MLDHLRRNTGILDTITSTGKLDEATEQALSDAIDQFRRGFLKFDGAALVAVAEAMPEVDVHQEQIVRQKRA